MWRQTLYLNLQIIKYSRQLLVQKWESIWLNGGSAKFVIYSSFFFLNNYCMSHNGYSHEPRNIHQFSFLFLNSKFKKQKSTWLNENHLAATSKSTSSQKNNKKTKVQIADTAFGLLGAVLPEKNTDQEEIKKHEEECCLVLLVLPLM